MKKALSLILAGLLMTVSLAGCTPKTSEDQNDPVTLTMWHVYGSQTESPLNDSILEFNRTIGKDNGIVINVVSVSSSSAIDSALEASAKNEPGTPPLPDLFTAYPRVAEIVGRDKLLDWSEHLTQKELDGFVDGFLDDGYFGDQLLMLPIAKSTELLFVNQTLFDKFASDIGVDADCLSDYESLFETCKLFYDWSDGKDLFQINDIYHYSVAGMAAQGEEFVIDGKLMLDSQAFESIWRPMASAGIYGGLCMAEGYASDRWKTGEVLCNVGSTAGILYLRDYVTYPDNTTEDIELSILPHPVFNEGNPVVVHRGGGLFALDSDDERRNAAAVCFARWLTEKENNIEFVTQAGYLPVTDESFDYLFANTDTVQNERYRLLYDTVSEMSDEYTYCDIPLYSGASEIQSSFEKNVRAILAKAHAEYTERVSQGEDAQAVLDELTLSSLSTLRDIYA